MRDIHGVVADPGGRVRLGFVRDGFTVQPLRVVVGTDLFEKSNVLRIGFRSGLVIGALLGIAGLICHLAGNGDLGRRLLIWMGIYFGLSLLCLLGRMHLGGIIEPFSMLRDPGWLFTIVLCAPVFLLPPVFRNTRSETLMNKGPQIRVHASTIVEAAGGHRDRKVWVSLRFTNGGQVTYWVEAGHGQHILEQFREVTGGRLAYLPELHR